MSNSDKLKKQIIYGKILAAISEQAIIAKDVDKFIFNSIKEIGIALNTCRVYLYRYNEASDTHSMTIEWYAENVANILLPGEIHFSWSTKELKDHKVLNLPDIYNIPDEAPIKKILVLDGVKSVLMVPLYLRNSYLGFMGYDECTKIRNWEKEEIDILLTVSHIVSSVIERNQFERDLTNKSLHLAAIFESVQDAIITVDNDLNVIEANKESRKLCNACSNIKVGEKFPECDSLCQQSWCKQTLLNVLRSEKVVRLHSVECEGTDNGIKTIEITGSPLKDHGDSLGGVLVVKDITRLAHLEQVLIEQNSFDNIIGNNKQMQHIYNMLERLADSGATVLVTGESGTGKEIIARRLYQSGERSKRSLITVNCAALPESLLESELFGYVKGAFTGAVKDKIGRIQAAEGGVLFIDEIGDISPSIQIKLVRFLQEKEFERVGDIKPIKADVRVVAATNHDLGKLINEGKFREDLYYRLKVVEIKLPPLRERTDDIPLLVDHFCKIYSSRYKKNIRGVSAEVIKLFINYYWPGNIRELKNAIEHAVIFCDGNAIDIEHIPQEIKADLSSPYTPKINDREVLFSALRLRNWKIAQVARDLGVCRLTIYRKIEKFQLKKPAK